jgi:ferredoxin
MIKVTIDREGCISSGKCWDACPDFFKENTDDERSQLAAKFRIAGKLNEGVAFEDMEECVKQAAEECVKQAAEECPAQVIRVNPSAMGFDPV